MEALPVGDISDPATWFTFVVAILAGSLLGAMLIAGAIIATQGFPGRALWTALDYLYPACALHWHAARTGSLRVTHWRETAARQTGMYGAVKLLPPDVVRNTVRACCGENRKSCM